MIEQVPVVPLTFRPILKKKVWGGRNLSALGKDLPREGGVGESWELADLASTSKGGGGGGAERSVIAAGPHAGKTIQDAIALWKGDLMGSLALSPDGGFPLLVKYLDAEENLSVQVHPSPEYAAAHPGVHLKTESWYVLAAAPGAVIYKGLKPGVDRKQMDEAAGSERIVELLQEIPARVGDCHDLPSGTVHALGAGITVAEIQTASDTTYRLYDWAHLYRRKRRDLHLAQALECASLDPPGPPVRLPEESREGRLVRNEYYEIREYRLEEGEETAGPDRASACSILMVLEGGIRAEETGEVFAAGSTILVPHAWEGRFRSDGRTSLLGVGFACGG